MPVTSGSQAAAPPSGRKKQVAQCAHTRLLFLAIARPCCVNMLVIPDNLSYATFLDWTCDLVSVLLHMFLHNAHLESGARRGP
jgi:hypothetical protein